MRRSVERLAAASLALALSMVVSPSSAQSDEDRAAARAMAMQAVGQEEAGHWDEAIDLFRRAESLVHAPPHLLHIARAEVKLHRLVSARETYLKITREELAAGAPRAFVDAQTDAQRELAELEPRIPTLKVLLEGGKASVTIDGAPMSDALVGVDRPIDPGRHELRATGEGVVSQPVIADVAEGAHQTVRVVVESTGEPATDVPSPSLATSTTKRRGSKVPAYAAWGVGAAGLAVGTAMLVVNRGKRSDADALCPAGACPESRRDEIESLDADANQAQTLSWVGFGVGIAGVAAGTVLYILQGRRATETHGERTAPAVGLGGMGLQGRF